MKYLQRALRLFPVACLLVVCLVCFSAVAQNSAGAVYTQGNTATNNQVFAYARATDGTLSFIGSFATQGSGNGTGLFSQGSIVLSPDHKFLFVVNAGSNEITSFAVQPNGSLVFVNKVSSGGLYPNSLTVFGNLLYVVNRAQANIVGFTVGAKGALTHLAGSKVPLSGPGARPGEIDFSNDGKLLVVTETRTNNIDTFGVQPSGFAQPPLVQPSNGVEPFGFAFDNDNHLIVSEGGPSAESSYSVSSDGSLTLISGSVPDGERQACWVVNTNNSTFPSQYSYAANTGTGTLSSYTIGPTGELSLLKSTAAGAASARDMALSADSNYLYVLSQGKEQIVGFSIAQNGSLTKITTAAGLPPSVFGLTGF